MTPKILGIDYGKKRIGLAVSVPGTSFAVGYRILEMDPVDRREAPCRSSATGIAGLIEAIKEIIGKEKITSLVIGLPKQLDNSLGIAGKEVMRFADELKKSLDIPVIPWDERLTSKQAEVLLRDVTMSHKDKREQINVTAAQVMLQSYLDAQASRASYDEPAQDNPGEENHD
jgi:putative Holliday junction resolvase